MWKLFVILASILTISYAQCSDSTSVARARSNSQCSWYNSNSCCQQSEIASFTSNPFSLECGEPTKGCSEHLVSLLCGISCSPRWGSYVNASSTRPVICHDFAYQTWFDCRQSAVKTQTVVGNIVLGACHTISDKYSNEYDLFVNGFQMDVANKSVGTSRCFNQAPSFSFTPLFIVLSVGFILLF